jgi:hypothetical protein
MGGTSVAWGQSNPVSSIGGVAGVWSILETALPSRFYFFGQSGLEDPSFTAREALFQGGWPEAGKNWYCAQDVAITAQGDLTDFSHNYSFAMPSVARLGACPGVPIPGEVQGCYDRDKQLNRCNPGGDLHLGGTVDGLALSSLTGFGVSINNGDFSSLTMDISFGGLAGPDSFLQVDRGEGSSVEGFLFLADKTTGDRTVYCVGPGSTFEDQDKKLTFTLSQLSRLGSCASAPLDGSLDGCF